MTSPTLTSIVVATCLVCSQANAISIVDGKPKLEPFEEAAMQVCDAQGGCYVLTLEYMAKLVQEAQRQAVEAFKNSMCRNSI